MIGQTINHSHVHAWILVSCMLLPRVAFGQELKPVPLIPDSSSRIFIEIEMFRYADVTPHALTIPPLLRARLELFSNPRRPFMSLSGPLLLRPSPEDNLSMQTFWQNPLWTDRRYETLWMVLGSMEAGGAAYIAYRHIKRHGLW